MRANLGILADSYNTPGGGGSFVAGDYGTVFAEWDFSDTATITESAGAVSAVTDKSGNGRDILQATAGSKPTTGTRSINGLNALDFTGDVLETASSQTIAQPFYVAWVLQYDSPDAGAHYLSGQLGTSVGPQPGVSNWKWILRSNATNLTSAASTDSLPHLLVGYFNGASSELRLDGAQIAAGSTGSNGWNGRMQIGNGWGGSWDGLLGHALVYSAITDLSGLESALMSKWGL